METGRRLEGLRALAREPRFRRLIEAQVTSQAADGLYQIALASALIFDVTVAETPAQVTKILAVTLVPFSVIGPFTGPFIDRFSRRSILVGSSIARAILTLALIPALSWPEPVLLGLVVANVSVNRFFHSTKSAVLPSLVRPDRYLLANTVSSVGGMVFGLLGAVVGGPLVDAYSEEPVILAATGLMVVAAVLAVRLPLPSGQMRGVSGIVAELRDDLRDLSEGLRVLARSPRAKYAVAATWSIRGLLGFVLLAGLLIVRSRLEVRTTGFSVLLGAVGVGGFVGALLLPPLARRVREPGVAPVAFLLAAVATLALGPVPLWSTLVGAVFVSGVSVSATKIASDTMIQRSVADAYRGRAFAIWDIGYNGVFVVSALLGTLLTPLVGEIGIVILTGALYAAGAAALAAARRRLPHSLEVRSYAGSRGDEVPREIVWDGVPIPVAEVERSWREDRAGERLLCFRLRLTDGRRIQVARGERWRIERRL